jgi:hypothetical protein
VAAVGLLLASTARGQFSPGELSQAHQQLEGIQHCGQCHEVGSEISGKKCLTCHTEIGTGLETQRGFHFTVSSKKCIACHKEHLGRDAQTVLFDKGTFDHTMTGFERTGKHATIRCEDCHARKNFKSPEVLTMVARANRATYLGLNSACISCHNDRHRGTVGVECQSCHTSSAWSPASRFDHTKTEFRLAGKHASVQCSKCHKRSSQSDKDRLFNLATEDYQDCTPCHSSPHNQKFAQQSCASCHSPQDWRVMWRQQFDHNLTSFKLVGRHAMLLCQQCHKGATKTSFANAFKIAHAQCVDCHADYHRGEFSKKYGNDCQKCHTQWTFQQSTFPLTAHNETRFPLTGAHAATLCAKCHAATQDGRWSFHFLGLQCETCHKDNHGGQFGSSTNGGGCDRCHTTEDWHVRRFDHSKTRFTLDGKHAVTQCQDCHKRTRSSGTEVVQYRGLNTECESCHREVHAGQFAVNGASQCQSCHTPQKWTLLVFDHNVQSTFRLTGAHKKVPCRECHHEEKQGGATFVRFKPVPSKCETCHH